MNETTYTETYLIAACNTVRAVLMGDDGRATTDAQIDAAIEEAFIGYDEDEPRWKFNGKTHGRAGRLLGLYLWERREGEAHQADIEAYLSAYRRPPTRYDQSYEKCAEMRAKMDDVQRNAYMHYLRKILFVEGDSIWAFWRVHDATPLQMLVAAARACGHRMEGRGSSDTTDVRATRVLDQAPR